MRVVKNYHTIKLITTHQGRGGRNLENIITVHFCNILEVHAISIHLHQMHFPAKEILNKLGLG